MIWMQQKYYFGPWGFFGVYLFYVGIAWNVQTVVCNSVLGGQKPFLWNQYWIVLRLFHVVMITSSTKYKLLNEVKSWIWETFQKWCLVLCQVSTRSRRLSNFLKQDRPLCSKSSVGGGGYLPWLGGGYLPWLGIPTLARSRQGGTYPGTCPNNIYPGRYPPNQGKYPPAKVGTPHLDLARVGTPWSG